MSLQALYGVLAAYIIFSLILVVITYIITKKYTRSPLKFTVAVAIVMYLLLFWDHIPVSVTYQYYCKNIDQFTEYQSLDSWIKEHPNVKETVNKRRVRVFGRKKKEKGKKIRRLNNRFDLVHIDTYDFLGIRKEERIIVDAIDKKKMVKFIDYDSDVYLQAKPFSSVRHLKFWMDYNSCEPLGNKVNARKYENALRAYKNLGKE